MTCGATYCLQVSLPASPLVGAMLTAFVVWGGIKIFANVWGWIKP